MLTRIPLILVSSILVMGTTPGRAESPGEQAFRTLAIGDGDAVIVPLWPDEEDVSAPSQSLPAESVQASRSGKPGIRNVNHPSMIVVPPSKRQSEPGTTLVFAPGGGYGSLSLPNAVDIHRWADEIGANFVLLKYRVPKSPDDPARLKPLSDAQRAMRLLRSGAAEYGIDPNKIVFIGSSAGGHLACNLANNHQHSTYQPIDEADKESARPDAAVLMYPAYLTTPTTSTDSNPDLHLDQLSPQRTPPMFITVTRPDKFTWGAVSTMLQLRTAKVPAELHVYPEGGHGGCFDKYPLIEFVRPAARFLKDQGVFSAANERDSNAFLDRLETTFLTRTKTDAITVPQSIDTSNEHWTSGDRSLAALRKSDPEVISIWPGNGKRDDDPGANFTEELPQRPDGLVRITKVSRPTLHVWRPAEPDGRAVLVFPGGAYNALAAQHEGTDIAAWLNSQGITAFVAKYRVPRREGMEKHAVALQDAQRAIRIVRSRAAEFGVNPDQIGVLGFSAGGNLAALTVHQASHSSYQRVDSIDDASAKVNFAVLIYPAYLMADGSDSKLAPLTTALKSRNDYPPIYLAVAADDRFATDSLHYMLHLHQTKVPAELHVYASGGHGKGMRDIGGPFAQWTKSCSRWLADLKQGTTKHVNE